MSSGAALNGEKELTRVLPFLVGGALVVTAATLVFYIFWFGSGGLSPDPVAAGIFGDYFGGILNPVISLCALAALIVAVTYQKQELMETRKALKNSAVALETQAVHLGRQNFESTLFRLIELNHSSISSLESNLRDGTAISGARCVEDLYGRFRSTANNQIPTSDRASYIQLSERFWEDQIAGSGDIRPSLELTTQILKFIDQGIHEDMRGMYAKFASAALSGSYLALAVFWSITNEGSTLFDMLKKYQGSVLIETNRLLTPNDLEILGFKPRPNSLGD